MYLLPLMLEPTSLMIKSKMYFKVSQSFFAFLAEHDHFRCSSVDPYRCQERGEPEERGV